SAGAAAGFDPASSYSFNFVSAGSITGFSADKFSLNTGGFTGSTGTWSIAQSGNSLNLLYAAGAAVPEPSTYAALAGAGALAFAIYRRRKEKSEPATATKIIAAL
ncbi:MAG: hypothetical protein RLZZ15_4429, partial [Verrucomicrobiota bacterium]